MKWFRKSKSQKITPNSQQSTVIQKAGSPDITTLRENLEGFKAYSCDSRRVELLTHEKNFIATKSVAIENSGQIPQKMDEQAQIQANLIAMKKNYDRKITQLEAWVKKKGGFHE